MKAPVPPAPARASIMFTPNVGFNLSPSSTASTEPFPANPQNILPLNPAQIVASSFVQAFFTPWPTLSTLAAGAATYVQIVASYLNQAVPPLQLPQGVTGSVFTDVKISFVTPTNPVQGSQLLITNVLSIAQGLVNGKWINAQSLQGGVTYSNWRINTICLFYNASGGVLNFGSNTQIAWWGQFLAFSQAAQS